MATQGISRRKGTTDFGKTYEQKIAALIGVKCVLNDDIDDMWMATNSDGLGAFDDVVLFLQMKNGNGKSEYIYLFQIKHKDNGKIYLSTGKNDLFKYQDSFFKIRNAFLDGTSLLKRYVEFRNIKFILFTNTEIVLPGNVKNCGYNNDFLNTGEIFQISNDSSNASSNAYDSDFLQQTFFYHRQVNVFNVEKYIKQETDTYFYNYNLEEITKFFEDWHFKRFEGKAKLKKNDIESVLLEIMLSYYIPNPTTMDSFPKAYIWTQVINQFDFIFLEKEHHLTKAWQAVQTQVNNVFNKRNISLINFNDTVQGASHLICKIKGLDKHDHIPIRKDKSLYNIKNIYMLLWQVGYVPLILKSSNNLPIILSKLDCSKIKRKYIFLGRFTSNFPQKSVFSSFLNIDTSIMKEILKDISLSLQDKELVTLDELRLSNDVLEKITPDFFMELLQNITHVPNNPVYISRLIETPTVSLNVLGLQDVVSVVIVNEKFQIENNYNFSRFGFPVHWYIYKMFAREKTKTINVVIEDGHQENISILIKRGKCNLESIIEIENTIKFVRKNKNQTVHYYRLLHNDHLQWIYSNQNSCQIKPFISERALLSEVELFQYLTFNMLSGKAGEGKSTLLHYLSYNCPNDIWVVQLNMSDITEYIEEDNFTELKRFLHNQSNKSFISNDAFSWELFQLSIKKLNMLIVIDGIDEVEYNMKVENFLNSIKSIRVKTLIVTRPSLKDSLDYLFATLPLYLKPFTKEDCNLFINQTLQNADTVTYSSTILQKLTLWNNLVGIPLILKLFVSLLNDGSSLDLKNFDITDLFDLYISEQLGKVCSCSKSIKRTLSKLALFVFYNKNVISDLFFIEECIEDIKDNAQIYVKAKLIQKFNNDESPVFAHKCLAEFLVANFFLYFIKTQQSKSAMKKFLVSLFYKELENVRLFFDVIALKGSKLQYIITNKNWTSYNTFNSTLVDSFGRNALHIAASYGSRSDLRTEQSIWSGVKRYEAYVIVYPDNVIHSCHKFQRTVTVPSELIRKLLRNGFNPFQKDDLFKMDVFDFAIESDSLENIDVLFSEKRIRKLENINQNTLLYSVVRNGYINIFHQIKHKIVNLKILPYLDNLLHVALSTENFVIIKTLTNGVVNVNEPNQFGYTPLISWISTSKLTDSNYSLSLTMNKMSVLNGNQLKILRHLVHTKKVDLNRTNVVGETLLHAFSGSQKKHVIKMLIRNGAEVNRKTQLGDIPLHYASTHSLENVKLLLEFNSDVDVFNKLGITPLGKAVISNLENIAEYLIRKKSNVNSNERLVGPLNLAASKGHLDCVKLLINHGATITNNRLNHNNTLQFAVQSGNLECIKFLIDKGAKIFDDLLFFSILFNHNEITDFFLSRGLQINSCFKGESPIHYAVQEGDIDLIKALISYGADVNSKKKIDGYSPLYVASTFGLENVVQYLIKHGAIINIEDRFNYTPLSVAAQHGHLRTVQIIIESRNYLQEYGPFAIYAAASAGHSDIIDYLISADVDLNGLIKNYAPIYYGVINNNMDAIKLLVSKGALINQKTIREGFTPLIKATMNCQLDIMKYLMKNGAIVNEEDKNHYSALTLAAAFGYLQPLKFLVENGSNLPKYGPKALYFAVSRKHVSIVNYLTQLY